MPKVSVIMPLYNTDTALFERAVCSVLNQTEKNIELIIIDDGSTTAVKDVADSFSQKDKRVLVTHKPNGGVSSARNGGLDKATGEYITFVDSDDYIEPKMYEILLEAAQESNADIITSDLDINGEIIHCNLPSQRLIEKKESFETVFPLFSKPNSIATFAFTNKIFRRRILETHRFDEKLCFQEDLLFMLGVYSCAPTVYYVPKAFYKYYQEAGGLCTSYREYAFDMFEYAKQKMDELIKEKQAVNIDFVNYNIAYLYNISYYVYRTKHYIKDKNKAKKHINNALKSKITYNACSILAEKATSFDKRIAKAITNKRYTLALWLIDFVYSGKAEKLTKFYVKITHKG